MKLILFENKLKSLVNQVISKSLQKHFGKLTHNVSDDGYHSWFSDKWSRNIPNDSTPNRPFHKNIWGTLWMEDSDFYDDLMSDLSIFGFTDEQKEQVFIDYMNDKYKTNVKVLGNE